MPPHEPSAFPKNLPDAKLLPAVEIDEILTSIQHSHSFYYKVMNLEVWALVETLDGLFPGAWGQFMTNRQLAVKQFLERDRVPNSPVDAGEAGDKSDRSRKKEEARSQESERSRKKPEEE
ncbi:hypothetical protein [Microcoleus sp. S13_C5]|uniref:hypothetical protein n=1 Tax=Microcoleus sp. S13_C5 TaxID=3055411 RepID=UPI002FD6EA19